MSSKSLNLIIIFLLSSCLLHAIKIAEFKTGLSISLNDITYKEVKTENNTTELRINNEYGDFINSDFAQYLPEIRLFIAIPNESTPTISTFELKFEENNTNLINKYDENELLKLKFSAELIELGRQRDVRVGLIRIQPFEYDANNKKLKQLIDVNVRLNFNFELLELDAISSAETLIYFSHIVNQKHLNSILAKANIPNNSKNIDNNSLTYYWYDSERKYVKIKTTRDGIALTSMRDVLDLYPELANQEPDKLHLVHNGNKIRFYYADNGNDIIDLEDDIYFFGSRSRGDTTYYDNYALYSVYYLYYNPNENSLLYQQFPETIVTNKEIDRVFYNHHVEQELIYHRGFPQDFSETQPGEGWFWNILSPSMGGQNLFSDTVLIVPAMDEDINITLHVASCLWNPEKENLPAHIIEPSINGIIYPNKNFAVRARDSLVLKNTNANTFYGLNLIDFRTLPNVINEKLIEPNQLGIDYFTLSYYGMPFASNSQSSFIIPNLESNIKLHVPGFRNKNIWIVDTAKGYLQKLSGTGGDFIVASVSNSKSIITIIINDKIKTINEDIGLHIVNVSPEGNSEIKYFPTADNDAVNYISKLHSNSTIVICYNSNSVPTQSFISYMKSLGFTKLNFINGTNNWLGIKSNNNLIFEDYSPTETLKYAGFAERSEIHSHSSYQASINLPSNYSGSLFLSDELLIERTSVEKVGSSDLQNKSNTANVLVLSHKQFLNSANRYAEHRRKTNPEYKIIVVDVEDIYKEFKFGKKSPHAIKDFIRYVYYNWTDSKIDYVVLWGDASWDTRKIEHGSFYEDWIPSYGWPVSDFWYSLLDEDYLPEFKIGRVPINSDEQGQIYIDKLILNDTIDNNPWMKNFLMITGGQTINEMETFYSYGKYFYSDDNIAKTPLCADTIIIAKEQRGNTTESQGGQIQRALNNGVQWSYFIGHGSSRIFDMDGWQVQKLNNKGKYGYLSTLSCNTAAFGEPNLISRNEEYVLEKDKGFIGTGGSSGVAFQSHALNMGLLMLQALNKNEIPVMTYLDALWFAKSRMIYSIEEKLTIMHYTYLGDPLAKLKIQKYPDFYFVRNGISILNNKKQSIFTPSDSVNISGNIYNLGRRTFENVIVRLYHEYKDKIDTVEKVFYGLCYPASFKFTLNTIDKPGRHKITLYIDPDSLHFETNRNNNIQVFYFDIFEEGLYPLEPLPNWNKELSNPRFKIINPIDIGFVFKYNFKLYQIDGQDLVFYTESRDNEIDVFENYIQWQPNINLNKNKAYIIQVQGLDTLENVYSPMISLPFHTFDNNIDHNVNYKLGNKYAYDLSGEYSFTTSKWYQDFDGIVLDYDTISYSVLSVYGYENGPSRDAEIIFNDTTYITVPPDIPGFKLAAVSYYDLNVYAVRDYDTYNNLQDAEAFVRFLRDTVSDKDYILLATNGESFRAFRTIKFTEPYNIGNIDTLKYIMKNLYGSTISDTFDIDLGSYSFFGQKNHNFENVKEILNTDKGKAQIIGNVKKHYFDGQYLTKEIGPASSWSDLIVKTDIPERSEIWLTIYGYNKISQSTEVVRQLNLVNDNNHIDITNLSSIYSKLALTFTFKRDDDTIEPILKEFELSFRPHPELAISKSRTKLDSDTILRGDFSKINVYIENLSIRSNADQVVFTTDISSDSKKIILLLDTIPQIFKENFVITSTGEYSDNFDEVNYLQVSVNTDKNIQELYSFNNLLTMKQYQLEDTEKPTIVLKLDGKTVNNNDFVSQIPFIEIELHDNSRLEIKDHQSIGIGINRPFPGKYDTNFVSFGREIPKKASLSFYSDTLEIGENYFRIFVTDASGNKDTLTVKVFVSINGSIDNIIVYPNPFSEQTNIAFDIQSPNNQGEIYLEIYDSKGKLIKQLSKNIQIGRNEIVWSGRDVNNNTLPSGAYYFIIRMNADVYFEFKTGKMIKIN